MNPQTRVCFQTPTIPFSDLAVLKIENWNGTREVFTHNGKYRDELNVIMDEILNFFMVSMFQNFFQLVDSGGNGIRFLIIG